MASSVKIPGKRLNNELDNDSFTMQSKKQKYSSTSEDQLSDDSNLDISSYNTPPPSTIMDSRDRSISPNEETATSNLTNNIDDNLHSGNTTGNITSKITATDTAGSILNDTSSSAINSSSAPSTRDGNHISEADHQLQDDVTYISLCSALSVLRSQREMVRKDILKLRDLKQRALREPEAFIAELKSNEGDLVNSIPKQIHIINGDLKKLFKH